VLAVSALASSFAGRRGQFLQLQFELIEQSLAALRARAEQLSPHLGDHQLQMFDQSFGAGQLRARLEQSSLQRVLVFRKLISCRCHTAIRSQSSVIRSCYVMCNASQCVALNLPLMVAKFAADGANRFLRAYSRAAPM
jgi:hypothetical protein